MAKDKEQEARYKAEGQRRMKIRKQERIQNLITKQKNRRHLCRWRDDDSPTGWSQICDYQPMGYEGSICQYPCNGDC